MSRIYEALQRAEAERQPEDKNSPRALPNRPDPAPPQPQPVLQPVSFQRDFDADDAITPIAPVSKALSEDRLLESIRPTRWNISLEHLPSLEKRGPALEQFRSLRSRIREFRSTSKMKSILVGSALPQEGKSFVAANLAVTLALNKNSKVLLIDGDMRRSTMHDYFGCESHIGLTDYLAGKADLHTVMQRASIDSTPAAAVAPIVQNLVLIPSGDGGDKAGDLAGSPRFEELLTTLGPHFEWIIIDSSPVVPISDAVTMGRICDAVLLVARAGFTTFPMAQRAQRELRASNVIGFVLNAVDKPPVLNGYYGYVGTGD